MAEQKKTVSQQMAKRDEKGRFKPGGPGGPGRPRKHSELITTRDLKILAQPICAEELQVDAMILRDQFDAIDVIRRSDMRKEVKEHIEMRIVNQRMAALALGARLRSEVLASSL